MKIQPIYKQKTEMDKKISQQDFENLVKKLMIQEMRKSSIKEMEDDEDYDLGMFGGDFNPDEFEGDAMRAAMQDIGSEFEPLGKNRFEKNLNTGEFKADLQRQNLNLPNDKENLKKIKNTLDTKKAHEKKFGIGSLNETGEWSGDEDDMAWIESLRDELEMVHSMVAPGIAVIIKDIEGFDKYQGPYAAIEINGDEYKVWTVKGDELWVENFPIDNTSGDGQKPGFLGNSAEVASAIDSRYSILSNLNEDEDDVEDNALDFDITNLYKFIKDVLSFSESKFLNYAETAQLLEKALVKHYSISKKIDEGYVNPDSKIDRPKDAEGNPITLRARVEDLETGAAGRILRLGSNDSGKLTVYIEWLGSFAPGQKKPDDVVYPDSFVIRDDNRIIREEETEEIEESMIRSHANGRGQNLKPNNFPEEFEREAVIDTLNENLDNAINTDNDVFQVVDNDFNRAHYKDLIGKTFKDAPGYANVVVIENPKNSEIPMSKSVKQEPIEEEYDYAREEINFHDQENIKDLQQYTEKNLKIKNIDDMYNLVFPDKRRVQSVLDSLKDEINSMHIINDIVAATDYMDTDWLFDITGVDNKNVYLDFTGTAK